MKYVGYAQFEMSRILYCEHAQDIGVTSQLSSRTPACKHNDMQQIINTSWAQAVGPCLVVCQAAGVDDGVVNALDLHQILLGLALPEQDVAIPHLVQHVVLHRDSDTR